MLTRIHATAYVVASGLGVLVLLLMGLIQGIMTVVTMAQTATPTADPEAYVPLVLVTSELGSLFCICGSLLSVVIGGLYGFWASRASQGADDGVIGGGGSGATAQALGTMIQTGISLMATPFLPGLYGAPAGSGADPTLLGVSLLTTGLGSLVGVCSSALFGGLLGALGGILGSALGRRA